MAHLIPAAWTARATLATKGWSLSRDNLTGVMRDNGIGVSNERASLLLKILRAEEDVTPLAAGFGPLDGVASDEACSETAA